MYIYVDIYISTQHLGDFRGCSKSPFVPILGGDDLRNKLRESFTEEYSKGPHFFSAKVGDILQKQS